MKCTHKECCLSSITLDCGIANILTSIGLQENSISHIIHAESEKLDAILSSNDVSFENIMFINTSIKNTLEALLQLEQLLQRKLDFVTTRVNFLCKLNKSSTFEQDIQDIYTSIANVEAALAAITNAEGSKIQKIVSMLDTATDELLHTNSSVRDVIEIITQFELVLKRKACLCKTFLHQQCEKDIGEYLCK